MNLNKNHIREVLIQLLKEGRTAEVPASGISMYPLLHPGDVLTVEPRLPEVGEIGVFDNGEVLISHRLLKRQGRDYYFKGDSLIFPDKVVSEENVLGLVVERKRGDSKSECNGFVFRFFEKIMPAVSPYTGRLLFYFARAHQKFIVR